MTRDHPGQNNKIDDKLSNHSDLLFMIQFETFAQLLKRNLSLVVKKQR